MQNQDETRGTEWENIAGREQAIKALHESEKLLREIAANYPNAYLSVIENDLTIGFTAGGEFKKTGMDPGQFVGMTIEQVFGPYAPVVRTHYLKAFGGIEVDFELFFNNQYQYFRVIPLKDVSGNTKRLLSVVENITERRRAEEKLYWFNDLMKYIISHAQSAIAVHDRDMKYIYVSDNYLQQYKVKEKDVIGKNHYDIFPDLPQKWRDVHQRVLAGAVERGDEDPYVREDGSVDWTRWECRPWYEYDGSIGGLIVYTEVITERVRREEALRAGEERFRSIVSTSKEWIWAIDSAGLHTFSNPAIEKILGYRPDEIVGHDGLHLLHGEDLPKVKQLLTRCIKQKTGWSNLILRWKHRDGTWRYLESNAVPILDKDGALTGFRGSDRDITDRKRAEDMLRESHENLLTVLNGLDAIVYVTDIRTYELLFVNSYVRDMFGDIIGQVCWKTLQTGQSGPCAFCTNDRLLDPDGNPAGIYHWEFQNTVNGKWYDIRDRALRWVDGRIVRMEIATDITERKEAEEKLRDSEARYRMLFDGITDAVFVHGVTEDNLPGTFLAVNDAACRRLGYSREELLNMSPRDIDAPESAVDLTLITKRLMRGECVLFEQTHVAKDGRRIPVEINAKNFMIKNRHMILSVVRDITDRKHLEDQLRQAQKMEAIGHLAGGVAHDFNNILSAIVGYAHLILLKMNDDDPLREEIEHILASSEKAANLTRSLLTFSRKQVMQMTPVHINDIVSGMTKILGRILGEDIELKVETTVQDLIVKADKNQMEMVLMNLASNARDAMPSGGTLTINTDESVVDDLYMEIRESGESGKYAVLSVTDTGTGMDEKTKENIFDPFFTTKEIGKGTGLGLAMIYGTVKQHEGFINVLSEPGKGTTFRIYLPLAKSETKAAETKAPASISPGTETILLVEDDEEVRSSTKGLLKAYGYTVLEAVDAQQAVKLYRGHKDAIQLVITDVVMPGQSGKDLYHELMIIKADIKILFISGYPADSLVTRDIINNKLNFLSKPFKPDTLFKKVRAVLDD